MNPSSQMHLLFVVARQTKVASNEEDTRAVIRSDASAETVVGAEANFAMASKNFMSKANLHGIGLANTNSRALFLLHIYTLIRLSLPNVS